MYVCVSVVGLFCLLIFITLIYKSLSVFLCLFFSSPAYCCLICWYCCCYFMHNAATLCFITCRVVVIVCLQWVKCNKMKWNYHFDYVSFFLFGVYVFIMYYYCCCSCCCLLFFFFGKTQLCVLPLKLVEYYYY